MDEENAYKLREPKVKEREEKRSKKTKGRHFTRVEWIVQRKIEKEDIVKFNKTWFIIFIRVASERFHNNFKVGYWVHPLGYMGFGSRITFAQHKNVKQQWKEKM